MTIAPTFPLSTAYLPGDSVSLRVFEDRYLRMVADFEHGSRAFASVLISRGAEVGGGDARFGHGVMVVVEDVIGGPEGLVVRGRADHAITIHEWLEDDPYPRAVVAPQAEVSLEKRHRFDVAAALTLLAQRVRTINAALSPDHVVATSDRRIVSVATGRWWDERVDDAELWRAFWIVATALPCGPLDRYLMLEPGVLTDRVGRLSRTVDHVGEIVAFRLGQ